MKKDLFFIVGAPKSGTTWLQNLLDGHPDICCKGESHFANIFAPKLVNIINEHNRLISTKNKMLYDNFNKGYPQFSQQHVDYLITCAAALLLNAQQDNMEFRCIGEKTPDHIYCLDVLASLFPHSKFIHIIRDGRDCAVSGWFHICRDTPDLAKITYHTFYDYVKVFVNTWSELVRLGLSFESKNPKRCLTLKYEDLHKDIDSNLIKLLEFLNMKVTPDIIQKCTESGAFKRLSKGRERGEEDRTSFYRKGIVGDWINYFDKKSLIFFENSAGNLLNSLGYEINKY